MTGAPPVEVELKFPIAAESDVWRRLAELGAVWSPPEAHIDTYFAHPARNFVETDEALRLRHIGDTTQLTYKGPLLDRLTRTRHEWEVALEPGQQSADTMRAILVALGFRPVRDVPKTRRSAVIGWRGVAIQCGWDEAPPLGTFLELEIVTDEAGRLAAQQTILTFAEELALDRTEPRSYLRMFLEHDASTV